MTSLFEHEQIRTTLPKAKDTARLAEKARPYFYLLQSAHASIDHYAREEEQRDLVSPGSSIHLETSCPP